MFRLNAVAFTDTPPALNVIMLPANPLVGVLPFMLKVIDDPVATDRSFTTPVAVYSHTSPGSSRVSPSPTATLLNVIWPPVVEKSSAVLAGVPLSSVTTTASAANVTLPVFVTL